MTRSRSRHGAPPESLQALREQCIPSQFSYPPQLPVSAKAQDIAQLIRDNQVVVIAGDTGSGKTTQLPKICLEAGLGRAGLIGHTQPRRLAALAVAERIAEELGPEAGRGVGSQVRFDDRSGPNTFLKLMTDGILLAEIQADRTLSKYEAIIIDEAHERSLNIDFLLGFLRDLITRRADLKVLITSATIDVEKFSAHFGGAPIVAVEGRTFPVEVRYRPIEAPDEERRQDDPQSEAILSALNEIIDYDSRQNARGDILVFLPSEREIRDTATALRKAKLRDIEILPLYGRLQHAEQVRIFASHSQRRVVLSTNVAETSITVPGINYVIDTGTARISRYSLQSKVQRLPIEAVSQASANQRKGRCGRVADGLCIRLFSEQDFEARPAYTDPEIQRTNLAAVILRMLHLRLGSIEAFPFLELPETKAINEGHKLLLELNAITTERRLTAIGRQMAVLPIDPKYSRMLVEAHRLGCLSDVLIIVAALSIQDPREGSEQNKQLANERHAEYKHPDSDFLSFVNLWNTYETLRQSSSQGELRKYCKKQFLSFMRMREWREVHRQLLLSCQKIGLRTRTGESDYAAIHKSLVVGSLHQVARKSEERHFIGTRNKKFTLFGSSVLARSGARWIVSGEQIETSQVFATQAAKIQPEWVEEVAMHLVKRESFDPHWSRRRQEVMAYEKVHLFGLVLVEKALVRFAPLDPVAARNLFIQHGLVPNQAASDLRFVKHNALLIARLEKLEEKLRRPDVFLSEQSQAEFFEKRLPPEVCSSRTLKSWLSSIDDKQGNCLKMSEADLLESSALHAALTEFPDAASIQSNQLKIDYAFDPGRDRDGATLEVPLALLSQLTPADVDWAVPGIIKEKCTALIKGLPKARRKTLIPVSGVVEQLMPMMQASSHDLVDTLCSAIFDVRKIRIERAEFDGVELLPHLQVKVRIVDAAGKELAREGSIQRLQAQLLSKPAADKTAGRGRGVPSNVSASPASVFGHQCEQAGLTSWPSEPLPESLEVGEGSIRLLRYPCLVDDGSSVSLQLSADPGESSSAHARGVLRLAMLNSVQQRNALKKSFTRFENAQALRMPPGVSSLAEQAVTCCYAAALGETASVRSSEHFDRLMQSVKPQLIGLGDRLLALLESLLVIRLTLKLRLSEISSAPAYLLSDAQSQLERLFTPSFIADAGLARLLEYPRYLEALRLRLAKAPYMGPKDEAETAFIQRCDDRLRHSRERVATQYRQEASHALIDARWMLEEYRISVFAQNLRTKVPVSPQRVERAFTELEKRIRQ